MTAMAGYLYDGSPIDRSSSTGWDAEGLRVAKGSAADRSCSLSSGFTPSSLYLLGQGGEQVTELSVAGGLATPAHSNVFWGGKLLATYDLPNGGFHIALTDPLGTKRVQVSGTGRSELNCLSLPYGNDLGNPRVVNCYTPTYGTPAPDATEHHFTGKERDAESGNDYFEARYYSSAMGRFMSPDWSTKVEPIPYSKLDDPQTLNLYSYVQNNPLIRIDLDGHACAGDDSACTNMAWAAQDALVMGNDAFQAMAQAQQKVTAKARGMSVTYSYPDGSTIVKKGTHPFRDNNPGDEIAGPGVIGKDMNFVVFATPEDGWNALSVNLQEHMDDSILAAITARTPPDDGKNPMLKGNDPVKTANTIAKSIGVTVSTKLSALSSAQFNQLVVGVASDEGFFAPGNTMSYSAPQ
jgi:RHS repeat-associated protein